MSFGWWKQAEGLGGGYNGKRVTKITASSSAKLTDWLTVKKCHSNWLWWKSTVWFMESVSLKSVVMCAALLVCSLLACWTQKHWYLHINVKYDLSQFCTVCKPANLILAMALSQRWHCNIQSSKAARQIFRPLFTASGQKSVSCCTFARDKNGADRIRRRKKNFDITLRINPLSSFTH